MAVLRDNSDDKKKKTFVEISEETKLIWSETKNYISTNYAIKRVNSGFSF